MGAQHIHIGTSGWHYDHWSGPFYPQDLPKNQWLDFYAGRFSTIELNNPFYHLPAKKTFENWRKDTPDGFIFSVKASRYITHIKRLKDPQKSLGKFFDRAIGLKEKLGPVLFQLPPNFVAGKEENRERLKDFLKALPQKHRYTIEFRDKSWFNEEIYRLLEEHNVAFCIFELDRLLTPKAVTADFVYIRLHGPGGKYQGKYPQQTLKEWADDFSRWRKGRKDVYCYFDNDDSGYAPQNARELQEMTAGAPAVSI